MRLKSALPRRADRCCASFHNARNSWVHGGSAGDGSVLANASESVDNRGFGGNGHQVQARFVRDRRSGGIGFDVQRQCRRSRARHERKRAHRRFGQHREFATGHVDRGQAPARNRIERRSTRDGQRRNVNVDADLDVAVAKLAHGKGVVDLGRRRIVDGKGAYLRARQVGRRRQRAPVGKRDTPREDFAQESIVVIVVRRRNRAAGVQQLDRVVLDASHAADNAFHSSAFLSGLYSSIGSLGANSSGRRCASN